MHAHKHTWNLLKYFKLGEFIMLSSVKSSMKAGGKIKRTSLDLINCVLICVFSVLPYNAIVTAMKSILSD